MSAINTDRPLLLTDDSKSINGVIYFRDLEVFKKSDFNQDRVKYVGGIDEDGYLLYHAYSFDANKIIYIEYYKSDDFLDMNLITENTSFNVNLLTLAGLFPTYLSNIEGFNENFSYVLYTVDYFKKRLPYEILSYICNSMSMRLNTNLYRFIFDIYEAYIRTELGSIFHTMFIERFVENHDLPAYKEYTYVVDKYLPFIFCWTLGAEVNSDFFKHFITDITIAIIDYEFECPSTEVRRNSITDSQGRGLMKIFKGVEKAILFNNFDYIPSMMFLERSTILNLWLHMDKNIEKYVSIDAVMTLMASMRKGCSVKGLNYGSVVQVTYNMRKLFDTDSYKSFEISTESPALKFLVPYIQYAMGHTLISVGDFCKVGEVDVTRIEVSFSEDGIITGYYRKNNNK